MKRFLSIFIGMMLLAGCGKAAAPAVEAAPTAAVTASPAAATATPTAQAEQKISIGAITTPTATPPATPTPSPTPEPTPTPTPAPTPFSLVVIPDTQSLAYNGNKRGAPAFSQLRDWIEAHRTDDNILGVLHTGDITDNGFKDWQWDNTAPLLEAIHDDLFFLPVAGNHDIGTEAKNYSAYLKQPFLNDYPEEQKFEGGKMLYRVLSAGGEDILLLGAGWEAYLSAAAQRWIDRVFADHEGMPCILVTHGFLLSSGSYIPGVEQLIAKHPAIRLVICGHARDYQTRVFSYDDDGDGTTDRDVNVLMLNMQGKASYAFRLLTLDPVTHDVTVKTLLLDGSLAADIPGAGPISFVLNNAY